MPNLRSLANIYRNPSRPFIKKAYEYRITNIPFPPNDATVIVAQIKERDVS